MKIFVDTANLDEIQEAASSGVVDGVTTNPSLIAKEKVDIKTRIKDICEIIDGPVSAEVVSTQWQEMVDEGCELNSIHKNVVVKIPIGYDGIKAVKSLRNKNIDTNVTLIFNASQALLAAKAGASFVSPFVGRLDDISQSGLEMTESIVEIFHAYDLPTQVLVASVRHPMHFIRAAQMSADVVTIPFALIKQLLKHPLTDIGLEKFLSDWNAAQK
tara:strand:- start:13763 stop:14407 length:645 start_codon:yes stop_codon:yes gene_type:complete